MAINICPAPNTSVNFELNSGLSYEAEPGLQRLAMLLFGAKINGGSATFDGTNNSYLKWGTQSLVVPGLWRISSIYNSASATYSCFASLLDSAITAGAKSLDIVWSKPEIDKGQGAFITLTGVDQLNPIRSTDLETKVMTNDPNTIITNPAQAVFAGDIIFAVWSSNVHPGYPYGPYGYTPLYTRDVYSGDRVCVWYKKILVDGTEAPKVTAHGGNAAYSLLTIVVRASTTMPPDILVTTLDPMMVNSTFSQSLVAFNQSAAWSVTGGSLPTGLTLSAAGVLSGTPTSTGGYSFTVQATNSFGSTQRSFNGSVLAVSGTKQTVTVAGLPKPTNAYSVLDGLSIAGANGDTIEFDSLSSAGSAVTVRANGTYSLASTTGLHAFQCRVRSVSQGNAWSNYFTVATNSA